MRDATTRRTDAPKGVVALQDLHAMRIIAPSPRPDARLVLTLVLTWLSIPGVLWVYAFGTDPVWVSRHVALFEALLGAGGLLAVSSAFALHFRELELGLGGGRLTRRTLLFGVAVPGTSRAVDLGAAWVRSEPDRVVVERVDDRPFVVEVAPDAVAWVATQVRAAAGTSAAPQIAPPEDLTRLLDR